MSQRPWPLVINVVSCLAFCGVSFQFLMLLGVRVLRPYRGSSFFRSCVGSRGLSTSTSVTLPMRPLLQIYLRPQLGQHAINIICSFLGHDVRCMRCDEGTATRRRDGTGQWQWWCMSCALGFSGPRPPPMRPPAELSVRDMGEAPPPPPQSMRPPVLKAPPPRHLMTEPATYPEDAHDELTYLLQRDAAVPLERQRRVALDGKTYLWVEFKEWYGLDAVRCWNEAGLGLAAVHCFKSNG